MCESEKVARDIVSGVSHQFAIPGERGWLRDTITTAIDAAYAQGRRSALHGNAEVTPSYADGVRAGMGEALRKCIKEARDFGNAQDDRMAVLACEGATAHMASACGFRMMPGGNLIPMEEWESRLRARAESTDGCDYERERSERAACQKCGQRSHWKPDPAPDDLPDVPLRHELVMALADLGTVRRLQLAEWMLPEFDAAQLRQALGLLSTLAPDVEMDADHPVEMAKAIEEVVIAQRKAQYGLGWIKAMQCVNKIDGFCVQSNLDPVHVDKIAKQVIECVLNHMRSEMP